MIQGLSNTEAKERLKTHGFNELPSSKPKNVFRIALEVMKEPMFLLLISCGVLYILIGNYKEGIILLCSIFIIIFITFYQYQKTEKALTALKQLSSPRALVLRDGIETKIPGKEVVPGDIIILHEGDRITADAMVLDTVNLSVDESILTGESVAVLKHELQDLTVDTVNLFSGTLVVQGKARAKVIATGIHTQFGKIGTSLQNIVEDETRLQKEMKSLIRILFLAGGLISVGVVAAFYFTRGNFISSLLNGLAAAMSILPEEFPVVLTVFLALGSWRLSRINVLTRDPSAIETLGSATVLCSDKTGTITQNKMEISTIYTGNEVFRKDQFSENKNVIEALISVAHKASQKDSIDPMEKAIQHTYKSLEIIDRLDQRLVKEYPLSKDFFAMTRVMESEKDHTFSVSAKGAPEAIFSLCKMESSEKSVHLKEVNRMAEQGFRVIGVATAIPETIKLPETQKGFTFRFLGLIGLEDPVRAEVAQAIKECGEAGIKVIMITGDYPATAKSIGRQIGLYSSGEIITGEEMKTMPDEELRIRIKSTNIFARVVPDQKLRIVHALKANNEIVAMTGDGVNDAPALKAADIGIAMGNRGTDVAREASSLVLLDDNFASIVAAIRSGRRIFDNLQKAMSFIIAIHIPIIGLTLLPAFFSTLPLLLMPLHIVFMELIIDPACSIAFEYEQEEKGIMKRPPRNPDEKFFGGRKIAFSTIQGFLLFSMVTLLFFFSIGEGHSQGEIRAITFSSLIIGIVFLILTNLSKTRNVLSVLKEKNIPVILILSSAIITLLLIISIPSFQLLFSFEFPGYKHFISSITGAVIILVILETIKFLRNRKLIPD